MITKTKKLKKTLKNRRRNINNTFSSRKKSLINKKKRLSRRNKVLKGGETPKTTRVKAEAPNTPSWGKVREKVVSKKVNVPAMQKVVANLAYGSTPFSGPQFGKPNPFGIASSLARFVPPISSRPTGSNSSLQGITPTDFNPKTEMTTGKTKAQAQANIYTELYPTAMPKTPSTTSWVEAYQSEKLAEDIAADKAQHEANMQKYLYLSNTQGEYIDLANTSKSNVARRPPPAVPNPKFSTALKNRRPAPPIPTNVLPSRSKLGDHNFSPNNEKRFENKIKSMQNEMKAKKEADTISGRAAELEQQMLKKEMQETEGLYQPMLLPITAQVKTRNSSNTRKANISSPLKSPLTSQSEYITVLGGIPNPDKNPYTLLETQKASPSSTGKYSSLVKNPFYDLGASVDRNIYSPTSQSTNANTGYRKLSTSGRNAGQNPYYSELKLETSPYYSEITNKNPNEYATIGNSPYAEVGPSPYAKVGPPTKKQESPQNSANIEKARQRQEISNKIKNLTNNIDYSNERRQRLGITEEEEKKINEKREQVKELVKKIKTLL